MDDPSAALGIRASRCGPHINTEHIEVGIDTSLVQLARCSCPTSDGKRHTKPDQKRTVRCNGSLADAVSNRSDDHQPAGPAGRIAHDHPFANWRRRHLHARAIIALIVLLTPSAGSGRDHRRSAVRAVINTCQVGRVRVKDAAERIGATHHGRQPPARPDDQGNTSPVYHLPSRNVTAGRDACQPPVWGGSDFRFNLMITRACPRRMTTAISRTPRRANITAVIPKPRIVSAWWT
jgi:hypothetical protein